MKYYVEGLTSDNDFGPDTTYLEKDKSISLRPKEELETTPYVGLTSQDIPDKKKKTLTDYLGDQTLSGVSRMRGNRYPVDVDVVQSTDLLDKSGYPVTPAGLKSPNKSKFVDESILPSRSAAATSLDNLARGRTGDAGKDVDGNDLLRNVTGDLSEKRVINPSASGKGFFPEIRSRNVKEDSPVSSYYGDAKNISKSVIYNRFNIDNPFTESENGSFKPKGINDPIFAKKYHKGASRPVDGQDRDVSFGRLAQIGNSLSIRSSLELNSGPGENPTSASEQAASILPGTAQLGVVKLDRSELDASTVIEQLTSEGIDENLLIDPAGESWGTMNNVLDQYAGISNFGMQLLAVALLVALSLIVTFMSVLFMIPSAETQLVTVDESGRYPYGAFEADPAAGANLSTVSGIIAAIFSGQFNLWRMLGITATKNPMTKCLPVGALSFFGVDDPGASAASMALSAATKGILSVTQSPGFYSIMARNVSRSFLMIGDAFMNLGKAFASGPFAGIQQLLELIDVLKNSKFIRAINVFSQLGDRVIRDSTVAEDLSKDPTSIGSGKRTPSKIDQQENVDAASKSRLKVGNGISPLTLAWSAYRSPDLLLMPTGLATVLNADADTKKNLGIPSMLPTLPGEGDRGSKGGIKYGGVYVTKASGRIDTDTREKIEDALESEYMPFYIHDVRTNEIVSFHAFLASLTDGYTASYDTSDAFGRVDPVYTYKNTHRKIGFSFYIVATNPNDFNSMWMKINKLTTMVYPQFSEGRSAFSQDKQSQFYVPFSQTIQAAPLVRVRIGDIIRSNYSKFNLARLFGYTYSGTKFDGIDAPIPTNDSEMGAYESDVKARISSVYSKGNYFFSATPLNEPSPKNGTKTSKDVVLPPGFVLKITEVVNGKATCRVEYSYGDDNLGVSANDLQEIRYRYSGGGGDDLNILSNQYFVPLTNLNPAPSTTKKIQYLISGGDYNDKVKDMMIDDQPGKGNAISRSFRSSGGKGLAGFIETLSFDWYDKTTWEIGVGIGKTQPSLGRRAPKMCKVDVSFAPIHDITPGLDHVGGNRAPVYPVGSHAFNDLKLT